MLSAAGIFLDFTAELKGLEGKIPLLFTVRTEVEDVVVDWANQNTPSATVEAFGQHLLFWEFSEQYNKVLADYLLSIDQTGITTRTPVKEQQDENEEHSHAVQY